MTHLARVTLVNVGPFRGTHRLDLEATAYGIAAVSEVDAERSNWLGKSLLLDSIKLALTGIRRPEYRTEDEWISDGEDEGSVGVDLSTGHEVVRSRRRGKSTLLTLRDGGRIFQKDEAERRLAEVLGMTADDYLNASYFEQGKMARLILAKPEERTSVVVGWLGIDALERCADAERRDANELERQLSEVRAKVLSREKVLAEADGDGDIVLRIRRGDEKVARCKAEVQKQAEKLQRNNLLAKARDIRNEYQAARLELTKLRAVDEATEVDAAGARRAVTEKSNAVHELGQRRNRLYQVGAHGFDGLCPVVQKRCPSRDFVERNRDGAMAACDKADRDLEPMREELARARSEADAADAADQARQRRQGRIDALVERLARDAARYEAATGLSDPEEADAVRAAHHEALRALDAAVRDAADAQSTFDRVRQAQDGLDDLREDTARLELELRAARTSAVVFGRQGSQRKIAEDALAEIEEDANYRLAEAGVDLAVSARWSREGKDLARACDRCGDPYPTSAKVKACARCGAHRGPNMIERLDLVLSRRSGAALDLAGVALGLAGGAWLRRERGSEWGVVQLDEPFGQLDAAHRRALSRSLTRLLLSPDSGVEQAFVIAHHAQVIESLPGKIRIVSDGRWSRVEVA